VPLIIDHPHAPPSGHYCVDSTGVTFRAKDIPTLGKAITLYRTNNALPAGNPLAEIETFYAVHFPWLISKTGDAPVPPKEDFIQSWINRLWRNPPKQTQWAESETAKARLQVCSLCPFNMPRGIVADVNLRRLIILGAGRIAATSSCCSLHRWDCGLAVWIEDPESAAEAPAPGCWKG
jgi:hypothetical protein